MIWFAMLIPVVCVGVLYAFFKHKVTKGEFIAPVLATLITIVFSKISVEIRQTTDTEYWTTWVKYAEYFEDWNEYIHETCTASCGEDCTFVYDCSYVRHHSPYWQATDNIGQTLSIDESQYAVLANKFGNNQFQDLHRRYHSNDGDKYITVWNGEEDRVQPCTTLHYYQNKVQASKAVIDYPEIDPEQTKVFEYPSLKTSFLSSPDHFNVPSILSDVQLENLSTANDRLCKFNAKVGPTKQCRVWLLVFGPGTTEDDGLNQEAYWKKGNKNEFVVCVGLDKDANVSWGRVFSWTDVEELKTMTKDFVLEDLEKPFDILKLVTWLEFHVSQKWQRKQFSDFSYVTVEPPLWATVMTFVLAAAASIGSSVLVIRNGLDPI